MADVETSNTHKAQTAEISTLDENRNTVRYPSSRWCLRCHVLVTAAVYQICCTSPAVSVKGTWSHGGNASSWNWNWKETKQLLSLECPLHCPCIKHPGHTTCLFNGITGIAILVPTNFNNLEFSILSTEYIHVFRIVLKINSDCFPKQH
jgi:hypothetical protein